VMTMAFMVSMMHKYRATALDAVWKCNDRMNLLRLVFELSSLRHSFTSRAWAYWAGLSESKRYLFDQELRSRIADSESIVAAS
jgi:hypothetical protein